MYKKSKKHKETNLDFSSKTTTKKSTIKKCKKERHYTVNKQHRLKYNTCKLHNKIQHSTQQIMMSMEEEVEGQGETMC